MLWWRVYYAIKHRCCPKRDVNKKQFSLTRLFPDISLTVCQFPDIIPTAVKFSEISQTSGQLE